MTSAACYRLLRGDHSWAVTEGRVLMVPEGGLDEHGRLLAGPQAAIAQLARDEEPRPQGYGITVLVSTACNLRCRYCFQNTVVDDTMLGVERVTRIVHKAVG
jgi:uncharacterized protein